MKMLRQRATLLLCGAFLGMALAPARAQQTREEMARNLPASGLSGDEVKATQANLLAAPGFAKAHVATNPDAPGATPRKLFERSSEDSYNNPGTPLRQARNSGGQVVFQNGDNVFMTGVGSSPQGDRPFLDRFNIKTGQKERIF